jgi:hypothetical protein
MSKGYNLISTNKKIKVHLRRIPKGTIGYTFYHKSEGKKIVAMNMTFLEKEFLSKEVRGGNRAKQAY